MDMGQKYAKMLSKLEGDELIGEIRNIISNISMRGCYLILENIGRVPSEDQEGLIFEMLKASPDLSKGVQNNLVSCYRPKHLPRAETIVAICKSLRYAENFLDWIRSFKSGEIYEVLSDLVEKLLAEELYSFAAVLAEEYSLPRLSKIVDLMIKKVVELKEKNKALLPGDYAFFSQTKETERLLWKALHYSVEYQLSSPLLQIRSSATLNYGRDLKCSDFVAAAIISEDEEWIKEALQTAVKSLRDKNSWGFEYEAVELLFQVLKQERFAESREKIFDLFYSRYIWNTDVHPTICKYLILLAHSALHFKNQEWMEKIFDAALKVFNKESLGHEAYEVFIILAEAHEKAKDFINNNPRPEWKFVLWA